MYMCKYFENRHRNDGDIGRMFWQSLGGGNRVTLARKSPGSSSCSYLAHYDGPGSSENAGPTLSQMPGPLLIGVAEILYQRLSTCSSLYIYEDTNLNNFKDG